MDTLKKIAMWTGIVLIGMCGVALLGGGKVMSGTLLIATSFAMTLPRMRRRIRPWGHAVLLCAVFGVVLWNISTTELPSSSNAMVVACTDGPAETYTHTGFKLLDQVTYIFGNFLSQASPS